MPEDRSRGVPSNPIYERVGEDVKLTAHAGVRHGMTPQDIIRQIAEEHQVHLNVGELRLLLAGRRVDDTVDAEATPKS